MEYIKPYLRSSDSSLVKGACIDGSGATTGGGGGGTPGQCLCVAGGAAQSAGAGSAEGLLKRIGIEPGCVTLWGSGEPVREFLYVEDMAEACVFLMENKEHKDIGEFINIGMGRGLKIRELAGIVKDITGFKGDIKQDRTKPDGMPKKVLDVSRMRSLGWEPKVDMEEGIRRTFEWFRGD